MTDNQALPPGFDLLWDLREPPRRGPKPGMSVEAIVRTAVELADSEGLAAVSMNRVAERLGNTAMSLYRYVRSKDELIQLMIDVSSATEPPPEPVDGESWRVNLERWAVALAGIYRRHPWVLKVPLGTTPPVGPGQLAWLDRGLACFAPTRVPQEGRIAAVLLVLTYIRGEFSFAQDYAESQRTGGVDGEQPPPNYGALLRLVVEPTRLPALAAVLDAGVFDAVDEPYSEDDREAQLGFGLPRVLDGIAVFVDSFDCATDEDPRLAG